MSFMKKILVLSAAVVASLSLAASAQASGETVAGTTHITSLNGPLYQTAPRPVNLDIRAEVSTPDSATTVLPMKRTTITFPAGMTFNPNNKVTPPCTDQKLNDQSDLSNAAAIVNACPKSVVGTGTAAIYIGKQKSVLIDDPILVVFNAGTDSQGRAKLKIYGYSKFTNVGILMHGTLKGRVLDVAIPMLSLDSAVKYFELQIPGPKLDRQDIGVVAQGLDKNYVHATCPSANGVWTTNSVFELGERDPSTGNPVGGTTTVNSPPTTQNCTGLAGKAKLKVVKVKGPKAVKRGKKGVFRITIKDPGTATAKNVVVRGPGAKRKVGNIAVGRTKTVKVKAKVKGRKGSRAKVKFVVTGKGAKTTKVVRVKVK
ncbi:MAG: hypothetical protein J0H98_09115 [Solirubrobacterales bacterium]|nr:hypothetical protein [Solirubrobacterales bacterium]